MGLRITDLALRQFRNYEHGEFHGLGPLTVFVGPNAAGKTNVVEAVQLLTALATSRHAPAGQLIRHGEESARIELTATDGSRLVETALFVDGGRRYTLNGKAKRPADLKGLLPSVTFTPDDLELVKGPQGGRRRALDVLGEQLNRNYYLIRKDYDKVLRHKNRLLKDQAPLPLVEAVNEMVVKVGAQLSCYRAALFEKLSAAMAQVHGQLAGSAEVLGAWFSPSWEREAAGDAVAPWSGAPCAPRHRFTREEAAEALGRELAARGPEERARGRALVGPQADAIHFELDGLSAQLFGSQGQQRSVVLAWKLAEAQVIEEVLGTSPVLLLDDVMSELDGSRRQALVDLLARDVQAFITTANLDYFDGEMLERAQVVHLPLE